MKNIMKRWLQAVSLSTLAAALSVAPAVAAPPTAQEQVFAAERAFAKSMADRDLQAFSAFVSDEAVFFGSTNVLRGKPMVVEAWSAFFKGPAPFSWAPDQVEVLESGTLAHSSGPVWSPDGKLVSRFNSIWRLEAPGTWRVIFDKGSPLSAAEQKAAGAPQ